MNKVEYSILGIATGIGLYSTLGLLGAGIGIITYLFVLAILILYVSIKSNKWPEIVIGIGYAGYLLGWIFKLMHWAGAGILLMTFFISIIGFIGVAFRLLNQKIYGSQKFSLVMVFIGFFMSLIHGFLVFFHTLPTYELEVLRFSFPILIIFPTILLLISNKDLFTKKSFYPLLLIISSFYVFEYALWLVKSI
jgi:hypothetical protein